jgi:hypothetical protein
VIVVEPKLDGNDSDQFPDESAVVVAVVAVPPAAPMASALTVAPGAVVPVTGIVAVVTLEPGAGELIVKGSNPGMPCVT